MEQHHNSSGISLMMGFILATFNHIFGWINSITPASEHMNPFAQALIMGFLGATVSFFTTKFWKYIEKKLKSKA
jgi:uncharacterized membrane protein|tara:strand:+ start:303 stop:524 length:222 start_codon:yes stop_codon:yes gene_type:complete